MISPTNQAGYIDHCDYALSTLTDHSMQYLIAAGKAVYIRTCMTVYWLAIVYS